MNYFDGLILGFILGSLIGFRHGFGRGYRSAKRFYDNGIVRYRFEKEKP